MSDITVAIPSFNCAKYLPYVLERLQHQKIPNLKVIIWDNGSTDGTIGYVQDVWANNHFTKKAQDKNSLVIQFFSKPQNNKNHPYVNAMYARKQLAKLVKTEYVFFLDPDVLIKPLSLPRLHQELLDTNVDYIGMKYEPDALDHPMHKHIMLGATLWKTDVFLKLPDCTNKDMQQGCDCNFCNREVIKLGGIGIHSKIHAEHLKNVFI